MGAHTLIRLLELRLPDLSFTSEYELQLLGAMPAEGNALDPSPMQTVCFLILPIQRNYFISKWSDDPPDHSREEKEQLFVVWKHAKILYIKHEFSYYLFQINSMKEW